MAYIYVPIDKLPRSFLWTDGNVYAPRADGTADPPADMVKTLVERGILPADRLPETEEINEFVAQQTLNLADSGLGVEQEPGDPGQTGEPSGEPGAEVTGVNQEALQQVLDAAQQSATTTTEEGEQEPQQSVTETAGEPGEEPGEQDEQPPATTGSDPDDAFSEGALGGYGMDDELPEDFPGRSHLIAEGYSTIRQADTIDLQAVPGIGDATESQIKEWIRNNVTHDES